MSTELTDKKDHRSTFALCFTSLLGIFSLAFPVQSLDTIFIAIRTWIWGLNKTTYNLSGAAVYSFSGFYLLFAFFFLLGIGIKIYLIWCDFKKRDSKFGEIRYVVEIGIGSIFLIGAIVVTIVLGNWGDVYHVYFGLITAYITGVLDIGIGLLRKFPR